MRKHGFIIVIAALCLAYGCKKPELETLRLKGNVGDALTNTPLSGVMMTLQSTQLEGGIYHSEFKDIGVTQTDASGNYSFEVETQKAVVYRLLVNASGYFTQSQDFDPFDITQKEAYEADFLVSPEAWIQLTVDNVSPWNSNDLITFHFEGDFSACAECCGSGIVKGEGPIYHYSHICKAPGGMNMKIKWSVTKANNTLLHTDSIFMQPFDTVAYQINY